GVGGDVGGGQVVGLLDVGVGEVLVAGDDLHRGAVLAEGVELLVEGLVEVAVLEPEAVAAAGEDLVALGVEREEGLDGLDAAGGLLAVVAVGVGGGVGVSARVVGAGVGVVVVAAGGDEHGQGGHERDES